MGPNFGEFVGAGMSTAIEEFGGPLGIAMKMVSAARSEARIAKIEEALGHMSQSLQEIQRMLQQDAHPGAAQRLIEQAIRTSSVARRGRFLEQAIDHLNMAAELETGLNQAKVLVITGLCYEMLKDQANALALYRDAYQAALADSHYVSLSGIRRKVFGSAANRVTNRDLDLEMTIRRMFVLWGIQPSNMVVAVNQMSRNEIRTFDANVAMRGYNFLIAVSELLASCSYKMYIDPIIQTMILANAIEMKRLGVPLERI